MKYPDPLIALGVYPAAYQSSNAHTISEQGKPREFVLEVASRHTRYEDTGEKRGAHAQPGIPEYWHFDETGEFYGDRLGEGGYEPVETYACPRTSCRATAMHCICTYDGITAGWSGTTPRPVATSQLSMTSVRPGSRPRPTRRWPGPETENSNFPHPRRDRRSENASDALIPGPADPQHMALLESAVGAGEALPAVSMTPTVRSIYVRCTVTPAAWPDRVPPR